jgi:hypothetical protein
VTNDAGCVLWGYLPASGGSAYAVTINKAGYVDPSGAATPSKPVDVIGESTNVISFDYDLGGHIQGNYQRWTGTAAAPANGLGFSATNANLSVPLGPWGDGAPHASYLSPLVYPFAVGYAVYAGDCAGAQPPTPQTAIVAPGATTSVNLRIPPISFQVLNGARPLAGVPVRFTATGSGCSSVTSQVTDAAGYIPSRDFLYGTYAYCVSVSRSTSISGSLSNNRPTGVAVQVDTSAARPGVC